jgi:hypothetical protein
MKAHFRFIGNNKIKADFCFIESATSGYWQITDGWLERIRARGNPPTIGIPPKG